MKTDSQVQQDVMAELRFEPAVDPSRIGVEVKDGVATLTGHVGSFSEKCAAERAAQRVLGVRALAVEMDVALPGPSERDFRSYAAAMPTPACACLSFRRRHGRCRRPEPPPRGTARSPGTLPRR